MKPHLLLIIILMFITCITTHAQRTQTSFDRDWKFQKTSDTTAINPTYNDASWRTLNLPHDWSIEDLPNQSDSVRGPFSLASIGATATGYTIGGTAFYRKHFIINQTSTNNVIIYFDGVYMNSDVWLNGHHLGNHPYGYTPFYYDLTPYLAPPGTDNVLAVRVRNEGRNSRWYTGSGIYRHVTLITTNNTHILPWSNYITTPFISPSFATVNVNTIITRHPNGSPVFLQTTIRDKASHIINATLLTELKYSDTISYFLRIDSPHFWSPDSPDLYTATTSLYENNKLIDSLSTSFGIRSLSFTATNGFLLNGQKTLLRGGCLHHDNGPLGSAAISRAEERKIELLKAAGYNAIRTSHNPPSQALLDACDRLGMLVIDEAFDQWQHPKNADDYHLYFDTCWQRDIDAMVLRDRNHPSIIFWSIGNEIYERADSSGLRIARLLRNEVKHLDTTRPVTEAICSFWDHPGYRWDTTAPAFALLDVGGYNYQWKEYENDHAKYPNRIIMGTESFPAEAWDNWQQAETHPYVIGDFVWTAFDYLGETGIAHTALDKDTTFAKTFPWFNAWCGDLDLTGGKKPQSYYRDVVWHRSNLEMLVHAPIPDGHQEVLSSWGWPDESPAYTLPSSEGKPVTVHIYTSHPAVTLRLNGTTIGTQSVPPSAKGIATFSFPYAPGTLTAYGEAGGKVLDSLSLRTAGKPARIRLTADRTILATGATDLCYLTAELVDTNGILVPVNGTTIHFSVEGSAIIKATASASPDDAQSFQQPLHTTYRGKCLAIIQPEGKGKIMVKAEMEGVEKSEIVLEAK